MFCIHGLGVYVGHVTLSRMIKFCPMLYSTEHENLNSHQIDPMKIEFFLFIQLFYYYVVPSVCLSVRLPVCPSVNFSCVLHNSDTVQDIFS